MTKIAKNGASMIMLDHQVAILSYLRCCFYNTFFLLDTEKQGQKLRENL